MQASAISEQAGREMGGSGGRHKAGRAKRSCCRINYTTLRSGESQRARTRRVSVTQEKPAWPALRLYLSDWVWSLWSLGYSHPHKARLERHPDRRDDLRHSCCDRQRIKFIAFWMSFVVKSPQVCFRLTCDWRADPQITVSLRSQLKIAILERWSKMISEMSSQLAVASVTGSDALS